MPTVPNSGSYVTYFERNSEVWFMPILKDRSGAIIQNTAKGPYPKLQVEPVSIGVVKATVRKSSYSDTDFETQKNAINNATWRGASAGNAWVAGIRTKEVNEGQTAYTLVRYTVLTCEYGWASLAQQLGYYYLSGGSPTAFTDTSGNPYLGCLDNSGGKLSSSTDMIIKSWDIKRAISFSALGF